MPSMSINDLAQAMGVDPAAPGPQVKIEYFFPQYLGDQLVQHGLLQNMARQLSIRSGVTIWVHYDQAKLIYRVGSVDDIEDCQTVLGCVLIHRQDYLPIGGLQLHQLPQVTFHQLSQLAPASQTMTPLAQVAAPSLQLLAAAAVPTVTSSQAHAGLAAAPRSTSMKIPKPRNSWIIYRQEKHHLIVATYPKLHTSKISQIISKMWRGEPEEVKAHYAQLAEGEKANHRTLYPGYKCSPRKSSQIKKRKTCKENTNAKQVELVEVQSPAVAALSQLSQDAATSVDKFRCDWIGANLQLESIVPEINLFEGVGNDFSDLENTTAEYDQQEYHTEENDAFSLFYDWN